MIVKFFQMIPFCIIKTDPLVVEVCYLPLKHPFAVLSCHHHLILKLVSIKVGSVHEFVLSSVYVPPNASASHVFSLVLYLTNLTSSFKGAFLWEILIFLI